MPASTRSKTGKLPQAPKRDFSTISDASDGSEDEQLTESASKGNSHRPKKRAKKDSAYSGKAESSQAMMRKKKGKLSNLPDMPLDILFEIFGHLTPGDLVRLARTTKAFRRLLFSAESNILWKESFEYAPGSPPCPDDISHRGWSHVLFGGGYCNSCGKGTNAKFMFMFRKRVCGKCIKTQFIPIYDILIPPQFSMYRRSIITTVPTMSSPAFRHERICDKDAIAALFKELEEKCKDIKTSNYSDLATIVNNLVNEKTKILDEHEEHVEICEEWQDEMLQERMDERRDTSYERTKNIKQKTIDMGYTEDEWQKSRLASHKEVRMSRPLTDKVWARILPILQPILQTAREGRLEREKLERRAQRYRAVLNLHPETLPLLHPMEFPFMPTAEQSVDIPSVCKIINADVPEINDGWRAEAKKALEATVEFARDAILAQKKRLMDLLPHPDCLSAEDSDATAGDNLDALGLASSVFGVPIAGYGIPSTAIYFGTDVLVHASLRDLFVSAKSPDIVFSERGRMIVQALLSTLGLDEKTTTTVQLDRMAARFLCTKCKPTKAYRHQYGTVFGSSALAWRAMVDHVHRIHKDEERVDIFRAVTEDELADVLPREKGFGVGEIAWGCCHCPMSKEEPRWMCEAEAMEHVKLKHKIPKPADNVDLFFNPHKRKSQAQYCAVLLMPET